jgi:O-antigen/teichoic acid export membrane protein
MSTSRACWTRELRADRLLTCLERSPSVGPRLAYRRSRMSSLARVASLRQRPNIGTSFRAASAYGVLTAGSSVLGLAKTIALAKVLGVGGLGYYGVVLLVLPFATYLSTVGTLAALHVELPLAFGSGDADAPGFRDRSLGLIVLATALVSGLYVATVALASPTDPNMRVALLLAAVTFATNAICEFYLAVLRARVRLVALGTTYFARAALALTATVVAGAAFGYRGAIVSDIVVLGVVVGYLARVLEPSVRPRSPRWSEAGRLIRAGIPLSLSNLLLAIGLFADRFFVAATLPQDLGQYTFAAIVAVAWFAVTGFVAQAVGASALHAHGGGLPLSALRRRVARAAVVLLAIGALGLPVILVIAHYLSRGAFSTYALGLRALPILYVGGALSSIAIYSYLLLAARRFGLVLVATSSGLAVGIASGLALAIVNPSVVGFAWTFVASQAVTGIATVVAAEYVYRKSGRDRRS